MIEKPQTPREIILEELMAQREFYDICMKYKKKEDQNEHAERPKQI